MEPEDQPPPVSTVPDDPVADLKAAFEALAVSIAGLDQKLSARCTDTYGIAMVALEHLKTAELWALSIATHCAECHTVVKAD